MHRVWLRRSDEQSDSFEPATDAASHLFDNWFDPIESGLRERVREFIEPLICGELDAAPRVPPRGQIQTIPGYTLSASGRSANHREFVAAQRFSLIRSSDSLNSVRKAR